MKLIFNRRGVLALLKIPNQVYLMNRCEEKAAMLDLMIPINANQSVLYYSYACIISATCVTLFTPNGVNIADFSLHSFIRPLIWIGFIVNKTVRKLPVCCFSSQSTYVGSLSLMRKNDKSHVHWAEIFVHNRNDFLFDFLFIWSESVASVNHRLHIQSMNNGRQGYSFCVGTNLCCTLCFLLYSHL